jgi:hypothetical protein
MNNSGLFIRKFIYVILLSLWGLGANAAAIITDPVNTTACPNGTASFTVVATGVAGYQWWMNTGSGWAAVGGGPYSGQSNATLVITSVTAGMNGYQYRCTVTGSPSVTSGAATLTVNSSPTISSPGGSVICGGAVGTVSASPSSGAWVDWYNAATAGVYLGSGSPLSLSPGSTTTYYGEAVYDGGGSTTLATVYNSGGTHDGVMFDVLPTKDITVTDFDLSLMANLSGTYSVYYKVGGYAGSETNAGAWTLLADGVYNLSPATMNVPSAMGFNLSLPLKANQAYAFYITINSSLNWGLLTTNTVSAGALLASNSDLNIYTGVGKLYPFSTTYSYRSFNGTIHYSMTGCSSGSRAAATITVNDPPAITAQPPNRTICTGSNTTFTVTATDATSYQWQINSGSGWSNLSNGSGYSGATTATLTITGAGIGLSTNQYRCRATGSCAPIATSNAGTLTVNNNPYILLDPDPVTVCPGQNASFSISILFGSSFQWQLSTNSGGSWSNISNGGVYSGVTTTHLTITGVASNMNNYRYRCQANTAGCTADISGQATLTVRGLTTVNSNPPNRTICDGANTTFGITANNATGYQWHVNTGSGWANVTNGGVYSGATTATLTLTGAPAAMDGYQYRCRATGLCSPPDTSNTGTLTITPAPAITVQPHDSTVCSGQVATFSVTATNATSYQWQANDGTGWGTLSNAGATSGTNTATLSFTGNLAYSGWQLRCVVSGCSPSVTSNTVTLTVPAPAITAQPPNRAICSGQNTTFTITATDATGYQWQENSGSGWSNLSNGGIYTGATTATLTLTGATITVDGYQYRCRASGCSPTATSNAGTLTINPAPAITANPQDSTICSGQNASFSITVTNATSYQWQENDGSGWSNLSNGGIYSGVNTATLTLTGATTAVTGYKYRCRAIGCSPVAVSSAGTLTVPIPTITAQPPNRTICDGANTTFTVTAINTNSYQWQVNSGSGWSNVSNGGIYTGATTATLTLSVTTTTVDGYQYRCIASGCSPSATSNAGTLTVNAITITGQPQNSTICSGQNTSFTVTAPNATSYQWQIFVGSSWIILSNGAPVSGTTTSTLSLTGVGASYNGYQFRCVASGCGPSVTSNAGALTISPAPAITVQPSNSIIGAGGNTSFSVTASNATTYQWQEDSGSGFNNIANGGIYSGATTSTLTLTAAGAGLNTYQYRCVVSGCSPSATSNAATLTVNTAPAITSQPSNSAICNNTNTSFSVTASNATAYQWQVNSGSGWNNISNGGIYSGATTATLSLTGATTALDGNQYRCEVTGATTPNAVSNAGTLTITPAPAITVQPHDSTVCSGQVATFSVTATDATSYLWQTYLFGAWNDLVNTGGVSGANTATLSFTGSPTYSGWQFRCVVGGCSPSDTSITVTITISAPAITAQPPNRSVCSGQNTTFTVTAANATGYQWQENSGSGWSNVSNGGIYTGATTATLTLTGATTAVGGYQYRCRASGCSPTATSNAGTLTVTPAQAITVQPHDSTVCSGQVATFAVTATAATSYLWQVDLGTGWINLGNGGSASGTNTATLSFMGNPVYNGWKFRCVVGGCLPSFSSAAATLFVPATAITAQPPNRTICSGLNTTFTVTATDATNYQWQENSGSGWSNLSNGGIYTGATTATLALTGATTAVDGYQYRCVASGLCAPSVTSNAGTLTINNLPAITLQPSNSTIGAGSNTAFSVTATGTAVTYQWQENSGSGFSNVTNGGVYSGAATSTLTLTAAGAGLNTYQYRCVVSGTCSPSATSNSGTLTVNSAPAITGQPSNSAICNNTNTSFSVTASNATAYQWQENSGSGWGNVTDGGIYSGATTATLSLTGATTAVNGYQYRCEITGATTPNAVSNTATLTINVAPSISAQPPNRAICTGSNTTFTVTATDATGYQWQVNSGSGWGNLGNGGIYTGATTATLTLTGAITTVDGYQYRCVASGSCSPTVTSNAGTLTINPPPAITANPQDATICSGQNANFSITATNATSYQWQENDGSGWSSLSDGGIYSGVTTTTLTLTAATTAVTGYLYRCSAIGCSPVAVSGAGTLTVTSLPAITVQPTNQDVCSGQNTNFTITATDATGYQWQKNSGSGWSNVSNGGGYSGATTATLTITNTSVSFNNIQYRCRAIGCSSSATSNAATLTVTGFLTYTTSTSTCLGGGGNFFSATAISVTSYQWQLNTGSGWNNISNGGIYTGATTNILHLSTTTSVMNGYLYRCTIYGNCGGPVIAGAGTLNVILPPALTLPSNVSACSGGNTSIPATVVGTTNSYQWQKNNGSGWSNVSNGGIYSGAGTATLTLTGATAAIDGYQYRCTGSLLSCSSSGTSNVATLTINNLPAITLQPSNSTIGAGSNTSFSVTATGTAITYQWQENSGSGFSNITDGGVYSGATTATLSLTAAGAGLNTYQYRCVVSGTCAPSATSNAGTLTVNTAPAITSQPSNSTICNNTNTSFSITASNATAYQWQLNNGSGWNNISDGGIYSGATTVTLNLTGATAALDGNQYRCEVTGLTTPNAISNAATLSINLAPAISTHPSNSIICNNSNATFTIAATDATGYQWQVNSGSGWSNLSNGGIYTDATTSTLTLTAATATVNGYQYRCIASGGCSPAVTSNAATITINAAPSVTAHPSNSIICDGANTSFSVTATGIGLGYQWQVNDGSGWANVSNSGIYTGVATSTLTLTAATTVVNSYQYRCVVNGSCNPSATSNAATLTINAAPAVTIDPSNSIVCDGGNTSFTVTATGAGLSYQWQVNSGSGWSNVSNGGIYSGAATNTLALTTATAAQNSYQYRCVVSGSCAPPATSNAATLSINSILTINTQPSNSIICAGNNAMFNVVASASGLGYQWQENSGSGWANVSNGGIYSGATTSTLTLTAATTAVNAYQYRCELSSSCTAPTNSNAAALTVNVAPTITAQPTNSTICLGSNTSFAITASGSGITYQWEVNSGSGWANVSNGGIYTGSATNTLNLTSPTTTVDGYQYRCVVGGLCVPGVISSAVTLVVNTAPAITLQPSNSIICSGSSTSFAITATGTNVTYQWEVNSGAGWNNVSNTGIYTGATTNTLDLTAPTTSVDGYQYRCLVNGICAPNLISSVATITINTAPAITSQPSNSTICFGNNTSFAIAATGTGLTYQWEVNSGSGWSNVNNGGIYTGATTNTLNLTSPTTAVSTYQYRCIVGGVCVPGITSSAVTLIVNSLPAITSQPSNSTICSGDNTSFNIAATGTNITYQWEVSSGSGWANVNNGGIYTGATASTLNLTAPTTLVGGYQYRCLVNGTCTPSVTSSAATITVNTAPAITTQPSNKVICDGSSTSFAVIANGTGLTYQWQVDNGSGWNNVANTGIYSGATTATLNLSGASTAVNTYQYRCVIGGACVPAITSSAVTLTVNSLPVVTAQPSNSTICSGDNTSFTIAATGTNITYQWEVNSGAGWVSISNGGIYSGATTNTLILTAATTAQALYQYRCVVSGTCTPAATSSAAILTINTSPAITTQPVNKVICEGTNTSFTVAATGTGLTYQWHVNNGSGWSNVSNAGIYSGATTATLNLTAATTAVHTYQYRCVITGVCTPGVTTVAVSLTINTIPVITSQPGSSTICSGNNTSFAVTATGTALSYQWQVNNGSGWNNVSNGGIYTGATASTLNLTAATTVQALYQYRCVVSGTCAPPATSSAATLSVNALPAITAQPSASTICENTNTSFAITATGAGITYQWQVNNGSSWSNVNNTGIYSGATTAMLSLTGATTAVHTYQYRCVVSGTCPPAVTSNAVTLTIQTAPVITTQPVNATKCEGLSHSFTVAATGTGLNYQWQVNIGASWASLSNGGVYTGTTTNTLSLTNIPASYNSYQYRCLVNGTCAPGVISAIATLTVNTNPVVTTQPVASVVICNNDNATIPLQATGTAITYQWQVDVGLGWANLLNGGVYAGVTTNTLILTNVPSSYNSYQYRCVVTGTCGITTSSITSLTVQLRPVITLNTVNKAVCDGTNNVLFTMDATGTALTYQWQVNQGAGWANLANNATYSGVVTKQLQIAQALFAMDGYQYRCVASGICPPDATTSAAILTVYPLKVPAVTITASDTDICVGTSVTFSSALVNGGGSPAYKWKVNGNVLGTGSSYTSTTFANNDVVVCELTSSYVCPTPPVVTSNSISMDVTPYSTPAITITSPTNGEGCEGMPVYFHSQIANGGNTPTYTWRINGNQVGTNIDTFAGILQNGNIITCVLTSSLKCPMPAVVTSNAITADILKITKSTVVIMASPDEIICQDEAIIMYSSFTNGGTNPKYQWIRNGIDIAGETQATMKPTGLNDKDIITCRFISGARCVFPELSNDIVFSVDPSETPEVGVTVSHIGNHQVMFKAIPKHEGATPTYQWFRDGKVITGAQNSEYITSDDEIYAKISVQLVSSLECVTSKAVMSRNITTGVAGKEELLGNVNLYPNPNTGAFSIEAICNVTGVKFAEMQIINSVGQLIYDEQAEIVNGKINHTIRLNTEPAAGTYILWIIIDGRREPRTFTVTR